MNFSRADRMFMRGFKPAGNPRNPDYIYLPSWKAWGKYIGRGQVELFGWGDYLRDIAEFPPEEKAMLLNRSGE